ncbi:hypothetical protein [Pseudoalteromonas piscicida]
MSEEIDKVDSLKALEDVFNVDPRNEQYYLEEWHRNLAEISLNKNTPRK